MTGRNAARNAALSDPLILANLALRLALVALAVTGGRWRGGDTSDYTAAASAVWAGQWGGAFNRPPLYVWFLAVLSPHLPAAPTGAEMAVPLLAQTLCVWGAGVLLRRHTRSRLVLACWLFDPVLLVYSNTVMSDALFASVLLGFGLAASRLFEAGAPTRRQCAGFGAWLGTVLLSRAIAVTLSGVTLAALAWRWRRRASGLGRLALVAAVAGALVFPRLYWSHSRNGHWELAAQGAGWLKSIAGIVENEGQGLDFIHAELKFDHDHPEPGLAATRQALLARFPVWMWLSAKGAARVLVGHVNVEWTHLVTGVTPLGPAWFKAPEDRAGSATEGFALVLWLLGLAATAAYCLFVYASTIRALARARAWREPFVVWALGCALVLALTPQVFGDARFRLGMWPFVILLWARGA